MSNLDLERKVFEVQFEFEGADEAEIKKVLPGDVVISLPQERREEWILVALHKTPTVRGYVPRTFLKQLEDQQKVADYLKTFDETDALGGLPADSGPTASAGGVPAVGTPEAPTAPAAAAGPGAAASPPPPADASATASPATPPATDQTRISMPSAVPAASRASVTRPGIGGSLSTTPRRPVTLTPRAAVASESFNELFARHEHYFRQVMKQREDTFKKLEQAMQAASKDIASCQEKNQKLAQRIADLDGLIEEERKRWKERLEAEKKTLLMKTTAMGVGAVGVVAPSASGTPPKASQ